MTAENPSNHRELGPAQIGNLTISRRAGTAFYLEYDGNEELGVRIEVLGVEGDQVKIRISAPKNVRVLRSELRRREGNHNPRAV